MPGCDSGLFDCSKVNEAATLAGHGGQLARLEPPPDRPRGDPCCIGGRSDRKELASGHYGRPL